MKRENWSVEQQIRAGTLERNGAITGAYNILKPFVRWGLISALARLFKVKRQRIFQIIKGG